MMIVSLYIQLSLSPHGLEVDLVLVVGFLLCFFLCWFGGWVFSVLLLQFFAFAFPTKLKLENNAQPLS